MNTLKKIGALGLITMFAMTALVVSIPKGAHAQTTAIDWVEIAPGNVDVPMGSMQQLTAQSFDQFGDPFTPDSAVWSSNNEYVATVDQNGIVTAHQSGDAIITATAWSGDENRTATSLVMVTSSDATLDYVQVTPDVVDVQMGSTEQLTASVFDQFGDPFTPDSAVWSSNNEYVATVDQNGIVTAHQSGDAIITATAWSGDENRTATSLVMVVTPE